MKSIICFYCLLIATLADTTYYYPLSKLTRAGTASSHLKSPIFVITSQHAQLQQYHNQDALGQYSYGYSEPLSAKEETRTADGITKGSYSYIDANSLLQTVDYTADSNGFRVAATNLPFDTQEMPQIVTDTPEVRKAREQHLAAHQAILTGDYSASDILPQPVEDTPEVAAAKEEFFARFKAEEERHNLLHNAATVQSEDFLSAAVSLPLVIPTAVNAFKSSAIGSGNGLTYAYQLAAPIKLKHFYIPVV
uniref:Cuticle protein 6 n=1 Tax=Glossina pallidipes TaxID=7398 RepID=A0A1B0A6F8_GLOPL